MNADELYEEMKAALSYFGLSFGDKNKMAVEVHEGEITFSHGNHQIRVKVNQPE